MKIAELPITYTEPSEDDIKIFESFLSQKFKDIAEEINSKGVKYDIKDINFYKIIDLYTEPFSPLEKKTIENILYRSIDLCHEYNYEFEKDHILHTNKIVLVPNVMFLKNWHAIRFLNFAIMKNPKYDTKLLCKSTNDSNCVVC